MIQSKRIFLEFIFSLLTGASLGFAWTLPTGILSASFEWIFVICLVTGSRFYANKYFFSLIAGISFQLVSQNWLYDSVLDFSPLSIFWNIAFYVSFVLYLSSQFVCYQFLFNKLPKSLENYGLRSAIAWTSVAIVWEHLKIFPWHVGYLQVGLIYLPQIADLFGVLTISIFMLWIAELLYLGLINGLRLRKLTYAATILIFVIIYGKLRFDHFNDYNYPKFKVAMIQADTSDEKYNRDYYYKTTLNLKDDTDLVLWPQSVITGETHESIGKISNDPNLRNLVLPFPLLTTMRTYRSQEKRFYSALMFYPDGTIPVPYHKSILVPLTEYIPLSDIFPALKSLLLNPGSELKAGDKLVINTIKSKSRMTEVNLAPLICYEDLFSNLARKNVVNGANLLADIAAGRWTKGGTQIEQHHKIARLRSIELRRSLLRASSIAVTSILGPGGNELKRLPDHVNDVLISEVPIVSEKSFFAEFGYYAKYLILSFAILLIVFSRFRIS